MDENMHVLKLMYNARDIGIMQQLYIYTFNEEGLKTSERYINKKERCFWS
jgi:hypothetical protein